MVRKSELNKLRRLLFERLEQRHMMAGDTLFFTKDVAAGNDRLIAVDGLVRGAGTVDLSTQPGYVNIDTGDTGLNQGVIDAQFVGGAGVVAIGGDLVQSFSATNITNQIGTAWDPDGGGVAAGVDALAIGDFGTQINRIVIARETSPAANDVLVLATDALNTGANVTVAGGSTSGGTAHGLALADFQTATIGNEVLIGFTNPAVAGGNGHRLFYNTAGNSGQFSLSRPISDVAAGNLNGSGNIDFILTGVTSPGGTAFGQGSLAYEANGAGGTLLDTPGLAGPHNPPWFNSVAIGNLDNDAALEVVLAGNDFVRVLDNNGSGNLDLLPALFESAPLGGGAQFVDVGIADADNDSVNEVVAVTDTGLVYMFGHSVPADVNSVFSATALGIFDTGSDSLLGVASLALPSLPAYVSGRNVFYNESSFDGNSSLADANDDLAVATDKQALLPSGTATFSNYTSFDQGINGVMIDIQNLAAPGALSLADFEFSAGNADEPFPWSVASQPINNIAADVRIGEGVNGSDRITLIWNANDIEKEWLEIRVKATASTGLIFDDVFYIGNAIGETGDSAVDALVTPVDVSDTVANPHGPFDQAAIIDAYDFNRDGLVTAADILIARDNMTTIPNDLELLSAPLPVVSPFRIVEESGHWFRLEESGGTGWNFDHFSEPAVEIDSALSINIDGSPLDFYLEDELGGTRLYLWEDGQLVPDLPHSGIKPTFAVFGDLLVEDIYAIERNPMTFFLREQDNVSASATTTLHSAQGFQDTSGGAGIILHPDHDQDLATFPGDPADHPFSGSVRVIAYGQGSGSRANAIIFSSRDDVNSTTEQMLIQDGTVTVFGNIHATGSITPGSSSEFKQDIVDLGYQASLDLIESLDAVSFAYIADPTQPRLGFIAEEVPEVFGTANRKGVDPMGITAALTVILQQQRETIDGITQVLESFQIDTSMANTGTNLNDVYRPVAEVTRLQEHSGKTNAVAEVARLRDDTGESRTLASPATEFRILANPATETTTLASPATESSALASSATDGFAASSDPIAALHAGDLPSVSPFQVTEVGNEWIELQNAAGTKWNFDHFSNPGMGINSALSINVDGSPLDFYIADETGGANVYLWADGQLIPNVVLTGDKPDFALWGDMLLGDIIGNGREEISHFHRTETNLSASAPTAFFTAGLGINNDTDGGAGILLRPDHHQDAARFPGDPVIHGESGTLQLTAYGQGSGAQANAIIFQTRDGVDSVADRMVIKDGTVDVFGDVVATGTITMGSSREIKQDIAALSYERAADLVAVLDAVSFAYLTNPDQPRLGYLAEEVPEEFGTVDRKGVDAMGITASLVLLAQQQQAEIDALFQLLQPIQAGVGLASPAGGADLSLGIASLATANRGVADPASVSQNVVSQRSASTARGSAIKSSGGLDSSSATGIETGAFSANGTAQRQAAPSIAAQTGTSDLPDLPAALTAGDALPAFKIVEVADQWMRLEETGGTGWNFTHVSNPGLGINSALSINIDGSPQDLYLADEPGGLRMYLWDDGLAVPNLPHTGVKPNFAISGDMLVGDLITMGRDPRTMFMREQTGLSASAATTLYSSVNGLNDVDGGATLVLHPDHHQDATTFPGDPADHDYSGAVELTAYSQVGGSLSNGIRINSRVGPNTVTDRMLIKDGLVTIYGNLEATGTITPGSSHEFKQNIGDLSYAEAAELIFGLEPVSFVYTTDPSQPRLGFIAEDVPEVFGNADRNGVDAMGVTAALAVVVQQQQQQLALLAQLLQPVVADSAQSTANLPANVDFSPNALLTLDMFATAPTGTPNRNGLAQDDSIDADFAENELHIDRAFASSNGLVAFEAGRRGELPEFSDVSTEGIEDEFVDLWGENTDWLHNFGWDGIA